MYDLSCLRGDDNHSVYLVLNSISIFSGIGCYMRFCSFDLLVCNVFVLDDPIILFGLLCNAFEYFFSNLKITSHLHVLCVLRLFR